MFKHTVEIISLILNILCWIHYYIYSKKLSKVVVFFSGAVFLGGIIEAVSIITTSSYNYPGFLIYLGPVPLFIAIGWGSTFYITYRISDQILSQFVNKKNYFLLFGMTAGLVGLVTDLCYDPVAVNLGWWEWQKGSIYFGVPISNFIGWFVFCFGFCFVYKYIYSKEWSTPKKTMFFYLSLVIVFFVTAFSTMPFLNLF